MKGLSAIILAAGLGTRMKSGLAKVLHPLAGRPMLLYMVDNVLSLKPEKVVAVVGHQADSVKEILPPGVAAALQKEQKGTAHAAMTGLKGLAGLDGTLLLVSGDTPLLSTETLKRLLSEHKKKKADISILTATLDDPTGYGRIIRDGERSVARIVEQKDADDGEKAVCEINSGTYCFQMKALKVALKEVKAENAQKEFYLTDAIAITANKGGKVIGVKAERPHEALGINSRVELARAEKIIRRQINEGLMASGVTIPDPDNTYIEASVKVGRDCVIYPGNHIYGGTVIGDGCTLMPGNIITDSEIKAGVKVKGYCVVEDSVVEGGAAIGPFSHIRPGSKVGPDARVGNFVELKKAALGRGAKASHLSYLGDSDIGADVNVGAGTITCNYDGFSKFRTVIEDGVFVGSDTQLVAPVRVGRGAVIAAGTTVTKDVPADALAISRTAQTNHEGWAKKNREIKAKKK